MKIVIEVSGGMVQNVYADQENEIEVRILDHDIWRDGGVEKEEWDERVAEDEKFEEEIKQMHHIY